MLVVFNFADDKFKQQQEDNSQTALFIGKADKVYCYHPEDIDPKFIRERSEIFSYSRGHGLWIWKAYFALKTLSLLNDGDYLMYCDAGSYFVNDIHYLMDTMKKESVDFMPFELPLVEHQWTKREVYDYMKIDSLGKNQILASYFILKKSKETVEFIQEWLNYMSNPICLLPKRLTNIPNPIDFIAHREDQSVFSILCHMHNFKTFRDPSQFGDWPWLYKMDYATYNPKKYYNSSYPRILISNRRIPMRKFAKVIYKKDLLNKLGLLRLEWEIKHFVKIIIYGKLSKAEANKQ